jgi:hypothetical protein
VKNQRSRQLSCAKRSSGIKTDSTRRHYFSLENAEENDRDCGLPHSLGGGLHGLRLPLHADRAGDCERQALGLALQDEHAPAGLDDFPRLFMAAKIGASSGESESPIATRKAPEVP